MIFCHFRHLIKLNTRDISMSQQEEQNELMELVEEQSDVIKEMAITQNALLAILMDKGFIESGQLESVREQIKKSLED
jgi:hypothetical protein